MTDRLTQGQIEAIRARASKATPGPLIVALAGKNNELLQSPEECAQYAYDTVMHRDSNRLYVVVEGGDKFNPDDTSMVAMTGNGPTSKANADFIAHSREDIPTLLSELDAVRQERDEAVATAEKMRKALNHYTDAEALDDYIFIGDWGEEPSLMLDITFVARDALSTPPASTLNSIKREAKLEILHLVETKLNHLSKSGFEEWFTACVSELENPAEENNSEA